MKKLIPFYQGKVRDIYQVDETSMLLVSTDRLSAFDVVFKEEIPGKGKILNNVSRCWFEEIRNSGMQKTLNFTDHLISSNFDEFPPIFQKDERFRDRSMLVKRVNRIDFECVVRGYLAGSGWKEYSSTGKICGENLPEGLELSEKLPEPIFTPATKAELGEHDENVTFLFMQKKIGFELANRLKEISIAIFQHATQKLRAAGIIRCDTKFEFGLDKENNIVIIDEILTPDSSRYWDSYKYESGKNQDSFDKQIVRDYLESSGWDKTPPPPPLPEKIIQKTIERYREIELRLNNALSM